MTREVKTAVSGHLHCGYFLVNYFNQVLVGLNGVTDDFSTYSPVKYRLSKHVVQSKV